MKTAFGCSEFKVMAFGGVAMYFNLLVTELGRGNCRPQAGRGFEKGDGVLRI